MARKQPRHQPAAADVVDEVPGWRERVAVTVCAANGGVCICARDGRTPLPEYPHCGRMLVAARDVINAYWGVDSTNR